jgi:hypothetical protein
MNPHFTAAWRAVATAKISEFAYQCERLGTLARCAVVDRTDAADVLTDIAEAHSLGDRFGREYIINLIADAFQGPAAVLSEAAE